MKKNKKERDELLNSIFESEAYKRQKSLIDERSKTIKTGSNVIHLEYLGGSVNQEDIEDIKQKFQKVNLELSSFNKEGIYYNSLEEFSLVTYFVITQSIVIELLKGVGSNIIWDVIKYGIKSLWNKLHKKSFSQISDGETKTKEVSFGFKCSLDKNTSFNFDLKGDFSEEIIEKALNSVIDFLREVKLKEKYQHPDYVYYDIKNEKWISVDVMQETKKLSQKQKTKSKSKK